MASELDFETMLNAFEKLIEARRRQDQLLPDDANLNADECEILLSAAKYNFDAYVRSLQGGHAR